MEPLHLTFSPATLLALVAPYATLATILCMLAYIRLGRSGK